MRRKISFIPNGRTRAAQGAGGVPVRSAEDYRALYAASRRGNFPLLRTYSGTDDFIRLAEMYVETINNAWCAIPLFWFNQMDGRGPWDLEGSIREHQQVMAWYGEHDIPVELNEPHHWGMRDAPDVVFVVSAYLSAYNARAFGVKDYIAQLMFNSPPGLSDAMDLAKMLAVLDLIEPLAENENFRIWRQTRTGLLSYPLDPAAARGHLAASDLPADGAQAAHHPHRRPHRGASRRDRGGCDRSQQDRAARDRECRARRAGYDRRPALITRREKATGEGSTLPCWTPSRLSRDPKRMTRSPTRPPWPGP